MEDQDFQFQTLKYIKVPAVPIKVQVKLPVKVVKRLCP